MSSNREREKQLAEKFLSGVSFPPHQIIAIIGMAADLTYNLKAVAFD